MVEDLDDQLADQLADVADLTSEGYELINQTFRVESSYESSKLIMETIHLSMGHTRQII